VGAALPSQQLAEVELFDHSEADSRESAAVWAGALLLAACTATHTQSQSHARRALLLLRGLARQRPVRRGPACRPRPCCTCIEWPESFT
jgi:hypothetical protein